MLLKVSLKLKYFSFFSSNFFFHFMFLDLEKFDLDIFIYDLSALRNNV